MTLDPNERYSCDQALGHPWLNDRQNLEARAALQRKKSNQVQAEMEARTWTMGQQAAFILSVLIILGSYSALLSYLFNIGKPVEFLLNLKSEFLQLYDVVYQYVDDTFNLIYDKWWPKLWQ